VNAYYPNTSNLPELAIRAPRIDRLLLGVRDLRWLISYPKFSIWTLQSTNQIEAQNQLVDRLAGPRDPDTVKIQNTKPMFAPVVA
jgi:hypothetical protein